MWEVTVFECVVPDVSGDHSVVIFTVRQSKKSECESTTVIRNV
jgi:hypothetical protein